jgi:hypothetical protein
LHALDFCEYIVESSQIAVFESWTRFYIGRSAEALSAAFSEPSEGITCFHLVPDIAPEIQAGEFDSMTRRQEEEEARDDPSEEHPISVEEQTPPENPPLAYEELRMGLLSEEDHEKVHRLFLLEEPPHLLSRTLNEQMIVMTDLLRTPPRLSWRVVGSIFGLTKGPIQHPRIK